MDVIAAPNKKTYTLNGLNCPVCADGIETKVRSLAGVKSARVDFAAKTLTVVVLQGYDAPEVFERAVSAAKNAEPGITVAEVAAGERKRKTSAMPARKLARLIIGAVLFATALFAPLPELAPLIIFLAAYIAIGADVIISAGKNILRGRVFDENFLMTAASIGALAIGEYPEGVAVMLFYQVGEFFQDLAVARSRSSISALMDIRPDYARIITESGEAKNVSPEDVNPGDRILIKPGEKVPLDGIVASGSSSLDMSALSGESLPRDVAPGDAVLSGAINLNGLLTVTVTKRYGESTVAKILELVSGAAEKKAPTESFITRFSRVYTPVVVGIAVMLAVLPPLVFSGQTFDTWINRGLVFLVASCPCALVISIPLGFFAGIGSAARNGILIKGGNYLEALNNADTVVFDKTGTLTRGTFTVTGVNPANAYSYEELLALAAHVESFSTHPIAASILRAYGKPVESSEITDYFERAGMGVGANIGGRRVIAGNAKLMESEGAEYNKTAKETGAVVHIAVDGNYAGYIVISDEVKPDAASAIAGLKRLGVRRTVMLTGDNHESAETVKNALGLDEQHSSLLPAGKVDRLEEIGRGVKNGGRTLFVGDGINDAPVIMRADVGVAMGGIGSDAAIEAADIVLMTDEPAKLPRAIEIARRTRRIVWQNIVFALAIKAAVLILGAQGIATMWAAVFADVGVALLAVLNAMRVLKTR